jgi:hypothetical protein
MRHTLISSQIRGNYQCLSCYGAQYLAQFSFGGKLRLPTPENMVANLSYIKEEWFFEGKFQRIAKFDVSSVTVSKVPPNNGV